MSSQSNQYNQSNQSNQSNQYYSKYLKYKQKYLQLKNQLNLSGSGGTECLLNESVSEASKKIHEHTTDFMQNYKQYTLSVCQHCDEYIYKLKDTTSKDTTNQWSQNIQEIEIDQNSLNSISNPMIKEILEFILRKQNEIKEEKQKNKCKRIKDRHDLLAQMNKKSNWKHPYVEQFFKLKKEYKTLKCNEIIGQIEENNAVADIDLIRK